MSLTSTLTPHCAADVSEDREPNHQGCRRARLRRVHNKGGQNRPQRRPHPPATLRRDQHSRVCPLPLPPLCVSLAASQEAHTPRAAFLLHDVRGRATRGADPWAGCRAFYVTFEQACDTLRILKISDVTSKADLFFSMCDIAKEGFLSKNEICNLAQVVSLVSLFHSVSTCHAYYATTSGSKLSCCWPGIRTLNTACLTDSTDYVTCGLWQTKPMDFNILKERRKMSFNKCANNVYTRLNLALGIQPGEGEPEDTARRISRDEFLSACAEDKEAARFCERLGFLI
jgi:hypothetical protein